MTADSIKVSESFYLNPQDLIPDLTTDLTKLGVRHQGLVNRNLTAVKEGPVPEGKLKEEKYGTVYSRRRFKMDLE